MMHKILERMLGFIPGYPKSAPKDFVDGVNQLSDMIDWYNETTKEQAIEIKRLKNEIKRLTEKEV